MPLGETIMRNILGKIAIRLPGLRHQILIYEALREISGVLQDIRQEVASLRKTEAIRSIENEWSSNERFRDPIRLLSFAAQVNSQNGEDGMIAEIFRRIGSESKCFVEIGLQDGRESNTAFLIACGWTGYWIDGGTAMKQTIEHRDDITANDLKTITAMVTRENVTEVFADAGIPTEFDFLSLDIDQNTYYVWEGLATYRPRVVAIEYNATVPPYIDWKANYSPTRSWDGTQNYGASLKALELLGHQQGYRLVGCDFTGTNAFFVREDLVGDHFLAPYTAENHYEPSRYPLIHHRSHRREILDRPAN